MGTQGLESAESRTCQRLDNAAHRRINEAGDSVPKMRSARRPPKPKQMPKERLRSVAQLPTLTRRPQMEVSCGVWSRNTEVRCCLQTVWGNCAS